MAGKPEIKAEYVSDEQDPITEEIMTTITGQALLGAHHLTESMEDRGISKAKQIVAMTTLAQIIAGNIIGAVASGYSSMELTQRFLDGNKETICENMWSLVEQSTAVRTQTKGSA